MTRDNLTARKKLYPSLTRQYPWAVWYRLVLRQPTRRRSGYQKYSLNLGVTVSHFALVLKFASAA